jgi:hypothetical protein
VTRSSPSEDRIAIRTWRLDRQRSRPAERRGWQRSAKRDAAAGAAPQVVVHVEAEKPSHLTCDGRETLRG